MLGKKHIDTFVVTHYHMDHIGEYPYGGIGYLIEKKGFQIDKVVDRNAAKFVGMFARRLSRWCSVLLTAPPHRLQQ